MATAQATEPRATDQKMSDKTDKSEQKKSDQKKKSLDTALSQIERSYGKGAIMRMGEDGAQTVMEAISTGAMNLDAAIGIGGIPRGRISEIYGPESSGKTTVCLHVIANAQRAGGIAAFIDVEHALDVNYARMLGVDVDNLLVSQPDTGEQALEIAEVLIRSNAIDVVVIDSVAALVPAYREHASWRLHTHRFVSGFNHRLTALPAPNEIFSKTSSMIRAILRLASFAGMSVSTALLPQAMS